MATAIEEYRKTNTNHILDSLICKLKVQPSGSKDRLPPDLVAMLLYFRKIELLVMAQYAKEIKRMPSYYYPDIKEFSISWEYEETRHGVAIEQYLRIHGHEFKPVTSSDVSWKYYGVARLHVILSWVFWFVSPTLHMLIGLLNEVTTKCGYWALMQHIDDSELRKIISAIQLEEMRHLAFYQAKSMELLNSNIRSKLASWFLIKIWQPVGSGNDDVKALTTKLLSDSKIVRGFFHQMEDRLEPVRKHLPKIPPLVIADIKSLISTDV